MYTDQNLQLGQCTGNKTKNEKESEGERGQRQKSGSFGGGIIFFLESPDPEK